MKFIRFLTPDGLLFLLIGIFGVVTGNVWAGLGYIVVVVLALSLNWYLIQRLARDEPQRRKRPPQSRTRGKP